MACEARAKAPLAWGGWLLTQRCSAGLGCSGRTDPRGHERVSRIRTGAFWCSIVSYRIVTCRGVQCSAVQCSAVSCHGGSVPGSWREAHGGAQQDVQRSECVQRRHVAQACPRARCGRRRQCLEWTATAGGEAGHARSDQRGCRGRRSRVTGHCQRPTRWAHVP